MHYVSALTGGFLFWDLLTVILGPIIFFLKKKFSKHEPKEHKENLLNDNEKVTTTANGIN
jgi:hypothetical protein